MKETVSTITDCTSAGKDGYDGQAGIEAPGRLVTDNQRGVIFAVDGVRVRVIRLNSATAPRGTAIATLATPSKPHWKGSYGRSPAMGWLAPLSLSVDAMGQVASACVHVHVCTCGCVSACGRACVRACWRAGVRACAGRRSCALVRGRACMQTCGNADILTGVLAGRRRSAVSGSTANWCRYGWPSPLSHPGAKCAV